MVIDLQEAINCGSCITNIFCILIASEGEVIALIYCQSNKLPIVRDIDMFYTWTGCILLLLAKWIRRTRIIDTFSSNYVINSQLQARHFQMFCYLLATQCMWYTGDIQIVSELISTSLDSLHFDDSVMFYFKRQNNVINWRARYVCISTS